MDYFHFLIKVFYFYSCIIAYRGKPVKRIVGKIGKIFTRFFYWTEVDLGIPYRTLQWGRESGLREFWLGIFFGF